MRSGWHHQECQTLPRPELLKRANDAIRDAIMSTASYMMASPRGHWMHTLCKCSQMFAGTADYLAL